MKTKQRIYILSAALLILVLLYLLLGLNPFIWRYALSLRIPKTIALLLVASSIAFSSTVFQTLTNNRILTPSVLGLDSLYLFIQSLIVFLFGSSTLARLGENFNFILSVGLMVAFSLLLFQLLFKREERNIFFLLLVGLVMGTFFQSLSTFMQVLIDPNEFLVIQNRMFASFNNMNTEILWLALIISFLAVLFTLKDLKNLDILSLGRENAINLGVDYDFVVKKFLVLISILVSVSTALVGPITFLGLLVVNLARELLRTFRHKYLIVGAILIASIALTFGQLIAERLLNFSTPISIIINFIGGLYFIFLLLKESKI
ncbi:MAG TPA: iron chelate uptake ABC transporter family permease subunit [Halanaerobiaceae bacterium]|jgi:iron complex transport system permease protein|nr:iron chelate uptake ABC transporter family permease subunit [Bacillota bacterium]HHU93437.1 iron chelate uptake ABC transporter family permease subunit [Halanaerobiaceae bacterium]HOA39978.1 iron chelate uptake ABC transporter family permease subunit [Halanaerobiales bacterium]HPZ62054.1 iron chelate uptake ABC transporter family permease subunit [Halanaerobiales bacterium]HQD03449.1 iron chelate uptake ABC transporter family permease subunit [Halanaerobiales bacterium]